jgi:hypothetical protein
MYDNEVTADAPMTDRKMPSVINRVQGLIDLAANVRDHASKIGDTLLGSHPAVDSAESPIEGRGSSTIGGDIDQLNECLDLLESRLRGTQESVARLSMV